MIAVFLFHSEVKFKIPLKLKEAELDGLDWGCGYVAKRMKKVQNLGDFTFNATPEHAKVKFTSMINRGGLTIPTKTWRSDYRSFCYFRILC